MLCLSLANIIEQLQLQTNYDLEIVALKKRTNHTKCIRVIVLLRVIKLLWITGLIICPKMIFHRSIKANQLTLHNQQNPVL